MASEAGGKANCHALINDYDPDAFTLLSDFHVAKLKLERNRRAIDSLGSIICKYKFEDVMGINLLHKHYNIGREEIVVRSFHGNQAQIRPQSRAEVENLVVPYLWAYMPNGQPPGWYPVEYVEQSPARRGGLELLKFAAPLLSELGAKLHELGVEDLLGIAGLYSRDAFSIPNGYSLLETTDESLRTLTLEPVPESDLRESDTTQTLWIYSLHHNTPQPTGEIPWPTKQNSLHVSTP